MISVDDFVAVPIPAHLYQAVARRFPDRVATVIASVTTDFLERTAGEKIGGERNEAGLFWERLFLPSGTQFRIRHYGQYKEARLVGDRLTYNGKTYPSVSKMA